MRCLALSLLSIDSVFGFRVTCVPRGGLVLAYLGTILIRTPSPPRTTTGPWAQSYCRVLGEGGFV